MLPILFLLIFYLFQRNVSSEEPTLSFFLFSMVFCFRAFLKPCTFHERSLTFLISSIYKWPFFLAPRSTFLLCGQFSPQLVSRYHLFLPNNLACTKNLSMDVPSALDFFLERLYNKQPFISGLLPVILSDFSLPVFQLPPSPFLLLLQVQWHSPRFSLLPYLLSFRVGNLLLNDSSLCSLCTLSGLQHLAMCPCCTQKLQVFSTESTICLCSLWWSIAKKGPMTRCLGRGASSTSIQMILRLDSQLVILPFWDDVRP